MRHLLLSLKLSCRVTPMTSQPWQKGTSLLWIFLLAKVYTYGYPDLWGSFQECSRYMSPDQISHFLDGAIRNRISVRLIAEQHIALSRALRSSSDEFGINHNGIVNVMCSPSDMVRICGSFVGELCEATLGASPPLVIDGRVDATFPCVLTITAGHRSS